MAERDLRSGEGRLSPSALGLRPGLFCFRARLRLLGGLLLPPGIDAESAESGNKKQRDRDHKTEPPNSPFVVALF